METNRPEVEPDSSPPNFFRGVCYAIAAYVVVITIAISIRGWLL